MAQQTFTRRKRVRKFFDTSRNRRDAEPIEVRGVLRPVPDGSTTCRGRLDEACRRVPLGVSDLRFLGTSMLEFVRYDSSRRSMTRTSVVSAA